MALSLLQKDWLTAEILYGRLRSIATVLDQDIDQLRGRLEFLNQVSGTDLDAISVPEGTKTLLSNFRTALQSLIATYDSDVVDLSNQIRII